MQLANATVSRRRRLARQRDDNDGDNGDNGDNDAVAQNTMATTYQMTTTMP